MFVTYSALFGKEEIFWYDAPHSYTTFHPLYHLCQFLDQTFTLGPAQTGIGNGTSVHTGADFLAAVFNIAFDHDAFHQLPDIR